jgi:hypothetical protein
MQSNYSGNMTGFCLRLATCSEALALHNIREGCQYLKNGSFPVLHPLLGFTSALNAILSPWKRLTEFSGCQIFPLHDTNIAGMLALTAALKNYITYPVPVQNRFLTLLML